VDVETNAARTLGNERALLERVIDSLYAIGAHRQQKATENKAHFVLRPRQTVSIASKQNMLFTAPLHVSGGYPHPFISHCVMSCFDLCFWLVCLQLETKHVNTKNNALFQSLLSDIHFTH
jgi:hypothetical protein